eukprot:UN05175
MKELKIGRFNRNYFCNKAPYYCQDGSSKNTLSCRGFCLTPLYSGLAEPEIFIFRGVFYFLYTLVKLAK